MKPIIGTLSRGAVNLRGLLNVFTAGVLFLSTNPVWAALVGVRGAMLTALAGVLAQSWRNFLDQSSARRKADDAPASTDSPDTRPADLSATKIP